SLGLRLWEIYNRRLVEAANGKDRLITHYDFFFQRPELELRRITDFIGLAGSKTDSAGALVAPGKRHTHFTIDQLIDAGVSVEIIELYRSLIAEASPNKTRLAKATSRRDTSGETDLLPGSVSRVNTFVPERLAQIEHLYGELLAQSEARHRVEIEKLSAHYAGEVKQLQDRIMQINELLRTRSISLAENESRARELQNRLRK